jgi:hypothetical protein
MVVFTVIEIGLVSRRSGLLAPGQLNLPQDRLPKKGN